MLRSSKAQGKLDSGIFPVCISCSGTLVYRDALTSVCQSKLMSTAFRSPEILRIEELVRRVKDGDIKLPKFQRPFVWKRGDVEVVSKLIE